MANITPINMPSTDGLFAQTANRPGASMFGNGFQPPSAPPQGYGSFSGGAVGNPGGVQAGAGGMGGGNASASNMTGGGPNLGGMTNQALNMGSAAGNAFSPLGWAADAGNIGKGLYYGSQGLGSQVPDQGFWGNAASAANPMSQNPGWLQQGSNWLGDQLGQLFGSSTGQMGMAHGMAPSWMGTGQSSGSSMQGGGGAPIGAGNAGPSSGYGTSMPSTGPGNSGPGLGSDVWGQLASLLGMGGGSMPSSVSGGTMGGSFNPNLPLMGGQVSQAGKSG